MDTSEESVFLHIQQNTHEGGSGDIYISDGSGKLYSLSLQTAVRGFEFVDFEKINSLDGTFVANRIETDKK